MEWCSLPSSLSPRVEAPDYDGLRPQNYPYGSKVLVYRVFTVSILGSITMALGRYPRIGYLDPSIMGIPGNSDVVPCWL